MDRWTNRLAVIMAIVCLGFGVIAGVACGDGDDDGSSATPGASVEAEPDPQADPEAGGSAVAEPDPEAGTGVVSPKPGDAEQVEVALREWAVEPASARVAAGKVYFLVRNEGPEDAHEFVVVKTGLAPKDLPIIDGRVNEELVAIVDEIEPFLPDSFASITLELEAGSYVLLCNIAEEDGGVLESHVELGMRTAFTVE